MAQQQPVRWVASDADGLPMKRKQVAQACETCRKRKKRCIHAENAGGVVVVGGERRPPSKAGPSQMRARTTDHPRKGAPHNSSSSSSSSNNTRRRLLPPPPSMALPPIASDDYPSSEDEDATQAAASRLVELSSSRFVGDMNPEGIFMQAATPALPAARSSYRDCNDLGMWVPPYTQHHHHRHADDDDDNGDGGGDRDGDGNVGNGDIGDTPEQQRQRQQSPRTPPTMRSPGDARKAKAAKAAKMAKMAKTIIASPRRSHARVSEVALQYERAKHAYLKECLSVLPPEEDFAVLQRIYCERVQPLFPVLKEAELVFAASGSTPVAPPPLSSSSSVSSTSSSASPPLVPPSTASPVFASVLRQIIALAAAVTDAETAAPHLRLEPHGPVLGAREFHGRLADAAATVLETEQMIPQRLDQIRALLLLAFFYQPAGDGDRNRPSLLCNRAIHHFHTLGAHLLGYRPQRPDDDAERIFCALWALDRFCAVLYARPCVIHEQDQGKSLDDCVAQQPPCFRLFMMMVLWLDKVMQLYRPRQPFVLIDIPVFESMILDAGAEKLPAMHLATIEVLYHTVCVLSCRQPGSAFSDTAPTQDRTHLPHSIVNPRRSHSSDRIVWVVQTQPVSFFPFVPFAVSLSLSVQYKKMRYSRTPMFRTRSRAVFKDIVALLKSMGDVFLSVRVNAALGESIWRQMEKTANSLARDELLLETAHADNATANGGFPTAASAAVAASRLASTTPPHGTPQDTTIVVETPVTDGGVVSDAVVAPVDSSSAGAGVAGAGATAGAAAAVDSSPFAAAAAAETAATAAAVAIPTTTHSDSRPVSLPPSQPPTAVLLDLSVLDTLDTDIDLFGNFDPSFDLGAIDTALGANLDMGIPQF